MLTIAGAIAIVLAIKTWVVNPYRIPTSSMEPTLHCAKPAQWCEANTSDRVLANRFIYHFRSPHRVISSCSRHLLGATECGASRTFVKRLIGYRVTCGERAGYIYIDGKKPMSLHQARQRDDRTLGLSDILPRNTFPASPTLLPLMATPEASCDHGLGSRPAQESYRASVRDVLAVEPFCLDGVLAAALRLSERVATLFVQGYVVMT